LNSPPVDDPDPLIAEPVEPDTVLIDWLRNVSTKWMVILAGVVVVALVVVSFHWKTGNFAGGVSLLNDWLGIVAILTGALVTVFLLDGFTPRLNVRLAPAPRSNDDGVLVIGMQVENPSRIRAAWPYARLQVLQYALKEGEELSEWVAFTKDKKRAGEPDPLGIGKDDWPGLRRVFYDQGTEGIEGTERIYPGEVLSGELVVPSLKDANVIHVGLQVKLLPSDLRKKPPPPASRELDAIDESHTATCFVTRPLSSP
jgi:hypothetical protein